MGKAQSRLGNSLRDITLCEGTPQLGTKTPKRNLSQRAKLSKTQKFNLTSFWPQILRDECDVFKTSWTRVVEENAQIRAVIGIPPEMRPSSCKRFNTVINHFEEFVHRSLICLNVNDKALHDACQNAFTEELMAALEKRDHDDQMKKKLEEALKHYLRCVVENMKIGFAKQIESGGTGDTRPSCSWSSAYDAQANGKA